MSNILTKIKDKFIKKDIEIPQEEINFLNRFNLIMGVFHLIQGVLMVLLSNNFTLPVMTNFLAYSAENKSTVTNPEVLFNLKIGPAVASFLFLSALAHFLLISPILNKWYIKNLNNNINSARWIEYAFSSSIMIVIIAMLCGIYDIGALIGLFGLNAAMNLFGWIMEIHNQKNSSVSWISFIFGCFAGIIPWIVITIYFIGASGNTDGGIPTFVYFILGSLFVTFNIFAVNMYLQYKKVGKWKDYLYGEKAFIFLSLFAKSLLAWQVFSGTLR